ncbi:MAG: N-acetylmuramoyl-L-alanine amidase, partial [Thermoanaerobaculia bacterium]|nr:N-acetylmuramoyl-L-alanine amidase [Thermoanaerobaculia bacterium]
MDWRSGSPFGGASLVVLLLLGPVLGSDPVRAVERVEIGPGLVAVRTDGAELYLEAFPEKSEGLLAFARRLCGDEEAASRIAEENGTRTLLAGVRYRIPFELVRDGLQQKIFRALFPGDQVESRGWRHEVTKEALADGAELWQIASWFTGDGSSFRELRQANRLVDDDLSPGQRLLVPATLLRPSLRKLLPPPPPPGADLLSYRGEGSEKVAVYRLQPGEALYSSVVMRFTGRVYAEDVNALAAEIAAVSGIEDVTDIPVGYEVRIPFEWLLPEYLPPDHPRRREYEAELADSRRFGQRVRSLHLAGVTVILDAGHGGRDVGASTAGVWESLYVYDIMLRVRKILEERTAARVVPTLRDGDSFRILERDVLPYSRGHRVLTDPPYAIEDSKVGVNLRWYLANSVYRSAVREGADPQKVIFVSIHADSLHPSARGAMIYIPSAELTGGSFRRSGVVYASRKEYRQQPEVRFDWRQRRESEGLSRNLAGETLAALREAGVAIHPYRPIREKIIRKRSRFVPAVLRYNAVPAKMLVEVCNLANDRDRSLLQKRSFRQRLAEAIVQ